jgi:hypothetical protein
MPTTEPNSPIAFANASPVPVRIAGMRFGRMIRRNVVRGRAPSDGARAMVPQARSAGA